jgi:predicted nucleic acid-binding Zn ribbon protein
MPLYDFIDENTGTIVELKFSIHQDIPAKVEDRGAVYRRLFAPTKIIFHGTGFYTTDSMNSIDQWRKENLRND